VSDLASLQDHFDPLRLFRDCRLQPDDWQREILEGNDSRLMLLAGRRAGKSTTLAAYIGNEALNIESSVIVVSPTQNQSDELSLILKNLLRRREKDIYKSFKSEIEFMNGSRVVFKGGQRPDSIRGYDATTLVLEEAAYLSDEMFDAALPIIATKENGKILAASTPAGPFGRFFELWRTENHWRKIKVTADDIPRISADYLAEMRASMPESRFRSEFYCEFLAGGNAVFLPEHLDQLFQKRIMNDTGRD